MDEVGAVFVTRGGGVGGNVDGSEGFWKNVKIHFQTPRHQKSSRISASGMGVGPVQLGPAPVVVLSVDEGVACKGAPRQRRS